MATPPKGTLFLEQLQNNENAKIGIIFKGSQTSPAITISGWVTDEFLSFGTRSNYSELLDMNMSEAAERIGGVGGNAASGLAKFAVRAMGLGGAKFLQQTILSWDGSERPQFTVGLKFVALRSGEDPTYNAVELMKRCMPMRGSSAANPLINKVGEWANSTLSAATSFLGVQGVSLDTSNIIIAPNGYTSALGAIMNYDSSFSVSQDSIDSQVQGTCTVVIGKWFRALNQIIIAADFDFSRTTTVAGSPLFCEGKITFEPYRMITEDEFNSYFPKYGTSTTSSERGITADNVASNKSERMTS